MLCGLSFRFLFLGDGIGEGLEFVARHFGSGECEAKGCLLDQTLEKRPHHPHLLFRLDFSVHFASLEKGTSIWTVYN